jgi:hypothetical protein
MQLQVSRQGCQSRSNAASASGWRAAGPPPQQPAGPPPAGLWTAMRPHPAAQPQRAHQGPVSHPHPHQHRRRRRRQQHHRQHHCQHQHGHELPRAGWRRAWRWPAAASEPLPGTHQTRSEPPAPMCKWAIQFQCSSVLGCHRAIHVLWWAEQAFTWAVSCIPASPVYSLPSV